MVRTVHKNSYNCFKNEKVLLVIILSFRFQANGEVNEENTFNAFIEGWLNCILALYADFGHVSGGLVHARLAFLESIFE